MHPTHPALGYDESAALLRECLGDPDVFLRNGWSLPVNVLRGPSTRSKKTHLVWVLGGDEDGVVNLSAAVCTVLRWKWDSDSGAVVVRDSGTDPAADVAHRLVHTLWPELARHHRLHYVRRVN